MRTKIHKLNFYVKSEDIFEQFKNRKMAVFLDSSLENQLGQFSIIGLEPYLILKEEDGVFYKNDEPQFETFEYGMKNALQKYQEKNPTRLPLVSGAIGYFSYDYGRKFEHISTRHQKEIHMPEAMFAFYDFLIIDDKKEKPLTFRSERSIFNALKQKRF